MIPGRARNWSAVNTIQQSTLNKRQKMTTLPLINSISRSFPVRFHSCPARVRLLGATRHGAGSHSAAGWRLSWMKHRKRTQRSSQPDQRRLQYGDWFLVAQERHHYELQHRHRRRNPVCQHRRAEYCYWCARAFKQHDRLPEHCQWNVRSFRQHRRLRQHGHWR